MKKIYLKYLTSVCLLTVFAISFMSCSDDEGKDIETNMTFTDLPATAQKMLNDYFEGEENVSKVQEDKTDNLIIFYVETKDGYEIVFNEMGEWQQVDAPYNKTIPTGIIPEPISQTLNYQYNGYGVVEINTTGQNFHLVLSNNQGGTSIELLFNQSGEILNTETD